MDYQDDEEKKADRLKRENRAANQQFREYFESFDENNGSQTSRELAARVRPGQPFTIHDERGEMIDARGSAREAADAALEQRGRFEIRHDDGTPALRGLADGKIEIGRDFKEALAAEGFDIDLTAETGREALESTVEHDQEQEAPQLDQASHDHGDDQKWRERGDELRESGEDYSHKSRIEPEQTFVMYDQQGEMVNAFGSAREAAAAALEERGNFEIRHDDGTPAVRGHGDGKIELGRDFGEALDRSGCPLDETALSGREALQNALDGKERDQKDGRDGQGAQAASGLVPVIEKGGHESMSASDWKQAGAEQAKAEQSQTHTHEARGYDHGYGM